MKLISTALMRFVIARYGVAVLGTPTRAIRATEDRQMFTDALAEIGM